MSATGGGLTEAQMRFLACMMKNCKSKPDVDWDAVVAEHGSLTVKSAKERYRLMAIKFGWNKDNTSGGTSSNNDDGEAANSGNVAASPAPSTPRKRGGGVTKKQGRVGDSAKKGRGRKKAALQSVEHEGEDASANTPEMEMEDADVYGEA